MKKICIFLLIVLCFNILAKKQDIKIQKIENSSIESWFLEDSRAPLFSILFYLGDGAFSDPRNKKGLSSMSIDLSFEGTSKYSEEDISKFFDNYGAQYSSDTKHEYTSFYLSGLVKDIKPLLKMVCHIFKEASYPQNKLTSYKKKMVADMNNLESSADGIASRVFRSEVLRSHTDLMAPATGYKKDLLSISRSELKNKLTYLTQNTHRKVYLTGPKTATKIPSLLEKECGFSKNPSFKRTNKIKAITKNKTKREIILVPILKSNQAKIRIGRLLDGPVKSKDLSSMSLLKGYLAGAGFISELFTELRVKRGLTYTVSAYADMQSSYGRSGVSTFTKNERIEEMLNTIKSIFAKLKKGQFDKNRLSLVRKNLKGGYLFGFEKNESFLGNLMYLHHIGYDENMLFNFPDDIEKVNLSQLESAMADNFDWNDMTIVIVGDKSLKAKLSQIAPVRVVDWKDYL